MIVVGDKKGCRCGGLALRRPGMRGMGDVTPERLRAEVEKTYAKTRAAFSRPMTFAQLYRAIVPHLELADQLVGKAKSMKLPPGRLAEGVAAAARLRTVRNRAKVGYAGTPNKLAGDLQAEALEAVLARMRWQAAIVGQALGDSIARAEFVKSAARKVVNAPGSIIAWAGEQATQGLKGFGLPGWLLPVGLAAAGLVLAGPYIMPLVLAARRKGAAA